MRSRLPLLVLLASALAFLASLYLPWRSAPRGGTLSGWVGADEVAALLALALVAGSAVALLRPPLAGRLPLGGLGVGLAYFAAAGAVQLDTLFGALPQPGASGPRYGWAYGFYLGVGSGAVAGLAALVLRRQELVRRRASADAAAAVLGIGLLASFLLPWLTTFTGGPGVMALYTAPATIAAVALLLSAGWLPQKAALVRLGGAVALAVLTGATARGIEPAVADRYGMWVGVACVAALVVLEAVRARPLRLPSARPWQATLRAGGAVVLLVGLFLPVQDDHFGTTHIVISGWQTAFGAVAGALALLLILAPLVPRAESYGPDATLTIALLVATLGTFAAELPLPAFRLGYGAYLDFAGAALLLLALLPLRAIHVARRPPVWALPLAVSAACIAAILVPIWNVLPQLWLFQATAVQGWFSMAALLLAVYLVRAWIVRMSGSSTGSRRLTLVPLALLTLPALQLIRYRDVAVIWGGVILVALCLLLALLGWLEERGGGLARFRTPEFLRVDRLPGAEA